MPKALSSPRLGRHPSSATRARAPSRAKSRSPGWRRAEPGGQNTHPVDHTGYEKHPLIGHRVRDAVSRGEGILQAVTRELHSGGVIRVAHIRPSSSGIEWTTTAEYIEAAS